MPTIFSVVSKLVPTKNFFSDFSKLVPTIFFKIFKTGAYEVFILKNDENGYLYLADGEYLVTIGTLALLLFFGSIFDFLT